MVDEIKARVPRWVTPQILVSAANFLTIVFMGGMVWSASQGDISNNKKAIEDLRADVRALRTQDRNIAVLQTDVLYIKQSVARIELRIDDKGRSSRP